MARKLGDPDPCGCGLVHRAPNDPGPDGKYDWSEAVRVEPAVRMRLRHWDPAWKVKTIRTTYSGLSPAGVQPLVLGRDGIIDKLRRGPGDTPILDKSTRAARYYECIDELAYLRQPKAPSRKPLPPGLAPLPGKHPGALPWQGAPPPVSPPGSKGIGSLGLHGNQAVNPQGPGLPQGGPNQVPPSWPVPPSPSGGLAGADSMNVICGDVAVLPSTPYHLLAVDSTLLQDQAPTSIGFGANAAADAVREAYRMIWRAWAICARWAADEDMYGVHYRWSPQPGRRTRAPGFWFYLHAMPTKQTLERCRDTYRALLDVMEGKASAGGSLNLGRYTKQGPSTPCAEVTPPASWIPPLNFAEPWAVVRSMSDSGDYVTLCSAWYGKKQPLQRALDVLVAVAAAAGKRGIVPWTYPALSLGPTPDELEAKLEYYAKWGGTNTDRWWPYLGWAYARDMDGRCTWRPYCGKDAPAPIPGMRGVDIEPNLQMSGDPLVDLPITSAINALYTGHAAMKHIFNLPTEALRRRAWNWFLVPQPLTTESSLPGSPATAPRDWLGKGALKIGARSETQQTPEGLLHLYGAALYHLTRATSPGGVTFLPYTLWMTSNLPQGSHGIYVDSTTRRIYVTQEWRALPFEKRAYAALSQILRAYGDETYPFGNGFLASWNIDPNGTPESDLFANPWPHARWLLLRQKYRGACAGPPEKYPYAGIDCDHEFSWGTWTYRQVETGVNSCVKSEDALYNAYRLAFRMLRAAEEELRHVANLLVDGKTSQAKVCWDGPTVTDDTAPLGRHPATFPGYWFGSSGGVLSGSFVARVDVVRYYLYMWRLGFKYGFRRDIDPFAPPVMFTCPENASKSAKHSPRNTIRLYDLWRSASSIGQAETMLHEMGHMSQSALSPRDERSRVWCFDETGGNICDDPDLAPVANVILGCPKPERCYRSNCSVANVKDCPELIRRGFPGAISKIDCTYRVGTGPGFGVCNPRNLVVVAELGDTVAVQKALNNIDNYVSFMVNRWLDRGACRVVPPED